jgi:hypothetical protein
MISTPLLPLAWSPAGVLAVDSARSSKSHPRHTSTVAHVEDVVGHGIVHSDVEHKLMDRRHHYEGNTLDDTEQFVVVAVHIHHLHPDNCHSRALAAAAGDKPADDVVAVGIAASNGRVVPAVAPVAVVLLVAAHWTVHTVAFVVALFVVVDQRSVPMRRKCHVAVVVVAVQRHIVPVGVVRKHLQPKFDRIQRSVGNILLAKVNGLEKCWTYLGDIALVGRTRDMEHIQGSAVVVVDILFAGTARAVGTDAVGIAVRFLGNAAVSYAFAGVTSRVFCDA